MREKWRKSSRKCIGGQCRYFESCVKESRDSKYAGVCKKYNIKVKDTLCGCEDKDDGSVVLRNFGGI